MSGLCELWSYILFKNPGDSDICSPQTALRETLLNVRHYLATVKMRFLCIYSVLKEHTREERRKPGEKRSTERAFKAAGTTEAKVTSMVWRATGIKRADATCPNVDHEPVSLESRGQTGFTGCVHFQKNFFPKKKNISYKISNNIVQKMDLHRTHLYREDRISH